MLEATYNLFVKVMSLSVMASVLALLILAARFLFKDRLKPAWTYLLWIPLVVRLAIPWTPESAFSIFNLLPLEKEPAQTASIPSTQPMVGVKHEAGLTGGESGPAPDVGTAGAGLSPLATTPDVVTTNSTSPVNVIQPGAGNALAADAGWTPLYLLGLVWLGGAAVVLGLSVRAQLRFTARVRREPEVISPDIRLLFETCLRELQVRRPVKLIETRQIAVPALLGVMRPKLLLPASTMHILEASGLRHVFLHELAHVKRCDIPLNLLTSLLLALHWFNPLLWYAVRQMKADQEVACDALALTHLEPECHRSYALTLLKLLETLPGPIRLAGAAGISRSKKEMERRIIMITRHKKITAKNTLLGLAVVMLLSGCTLTGAKLNSAPVPEKSTPAASPAASQDKDTPASGVKGTLLGEKNGITVTAKPTGENTLLHEVTVNVRGEVSRTFLWDAGKDETRPPIIDEADVNGDGTKEIFIRITTGTGTGVYMNDIHVLQPATLEELVVEDPVEALNRRLKSSITHRDNHTYVSAELDGKHMSKVYDYTEAAWGEKVGFGAIVSYELTGGRIVAHLAGAASMNEFPLEVVAVYGKDLTLDSVQMYYGSFIAPPLSEQEIKSMMEKRLPATGWTFGKDGGQYTVDFTDPPNGEEQGNTYKINPFTGTVYDAISGNPLRSLVNREAIDLWEISDGSKYQKELYKLLQPILDTEGFEPVSKDWISGFTGDGYLLGEVRKEGREFTIKADVFTSQWEEIPDPYK
ncbi:M56 family metallopeptidase [Paenibacillus sp. FSL M7-1046]|uniref:M56 family metallopeptidase n=1 Tax=Paenibacillus sp. FSL M7-1046 TaxID=2975315 RepID=UPI0030F52E17